MKLIEFIEKYPDEESCRLAWKQMREKQGIVCKKCEGTFHRWEVRYDRYRCKECGFQTSLRSGTVMEGSNLPFRTWMIAIHLMSSTKKGISAKELQRQLGMKRYEPAWYLMFKIRRAMSHSEGKRKLKGEIEVDEGYFRTAYFTDEDQELLRGRGSQRCSPVIVYAESEACEKAKPKAFRCGSFAMDAVEYLDSETINSSLRKNTCRGCRIRTDGYKGYLKSTKHVKEHLSKPVPPKQAGEVLPWVHVAIANAKRTLLGVYHNRIEPVYLQLYLDEFTFKLNRRYQFKTLFNSLLVACIAFAWG